MKNKLFLILSIIGFFGCTDSEMNKSRVESLPYFNDATFTPRWLKLTDIESETFHRIPSFSLINQDGDTITESTFQDKIYVANFIFTTCPGICPKMTTNMSILQEEFINDDDILLISHSVTPELDSVPVLKRYAESKGILSNKWHLVTGSQQQIYTLGRHSYFVEEDMGLKKDDGDFLHTENFVLIDKNRHIRGLYNGLNKTSINQLITDINTLKNER